MFLVFSVCLFLLFSSVLSAATCTKLHISCCFTPIDQTTTVTPGETQQWTQAWTLSIIEGQLCTAAFTPIGFLDINNLDVENDDEVFYLTTGVTTRVNTYTAVTYGTLLPQIATMLEFVHNGDLLAATSVFVTVANPPTSISTSLTSIPPPQTTPSVSSTPPLAVTSTPSPSQPLNTQTVTISPPSTTIDETTPPSSSTSSPQPASTLALSTSSESSSTSASSTQNPSPSDGDDDGLSTGGIIGIAFAGGTFFLTLVIVVLMYIQAAKKAEQPASLRGFGMYVRRAF